MEDRVEAGQCFLAMEIQKVLDIMTIRHYGIRPCGKTPIAFPYLCIQSKPLPLLLFCQCPFHLERITRLNLVCTLPSYLQGIIDKSLLLTMFLVFCFFV